MSLNTHIASKLVRAKAISGLWFASLYVSGRSKCNCSASFLSGCACFYLDEYTTTHTYHQISAIPTQYSRWPRPCQRNLNPQLTWIERADLMESTLNMNGISPPLSCSTEPKASGFLCQPERQILCPSSASCLSSYHHRITTVKML